MTAEQRLAEREIDRIEATRPQDADPAAVAAALRTIPDLRSTLAISSPEELTEIFDAFEISASYDKRDHSLEIMARSCRNFGTKRIQKQYDRPQGPVAGLR